MLDERAHRIFLSVSETLSFTRTAETLHMSVSAVSRAVQRMEEDLSAVLLERTRRGMRLSQEGMALRDYCLRNQDAWQRLRAGLGAEPQGELSLFCSVTATYQVLSPVLAAFRARHPGVEVHLRTGDQADGIERVHSGRDDVAIVARPDVLPRGIAFLELARSTVAVIAPRLAVDGMRPGWLPDTFDSWAGVPFVIPERGVTRDLFTLWCRRVGLDNPRVYAQVAGHEAILAMVALGFGVGMVPDLVLRGSAFVEQVRRVSLEPEPGELRIGLAARSSRLTSPALAALWETAGGERGVVVP